jgi:hypothetical protein
MSKRHFTAEEVTELLEAALEDAKCWQVPGIAAAARSIGLDRFTVSLACLNVGFEAS